MGEISVPPPGPDLHDPDLDGPPSGTKLGTTRLPAAPSMPLGVSCLGVCCIAFLALVGFFGTCIPLGVATLNIGIEEELTQDENRREMWLFFLEVMVSGCVATVISYWFARFWFRLDATLRPYADRS